MASFADPPLSEASRRYLAAFDEWLRRPSPESYASRMAALGGLVSTTAEDRDRRAAVREQNRLASRRYRVRCRQPQPEEKAA